MKKITIKVSLLIAAFNASAQVSFENLGAAINSNYSEVRPTISADGKTLFYVVEGSPSNTLYKKDKKAQDIWVSELGSDGVWGKGQHLPAPLNVTGDNAVFSVSPDGKRIIIRGAYDNGKYIGRGISISDKNGDAWTAPQQIKMKGYSRMSVDAYSGLILSNDGKHMILYFSEEKNSLINDLYYSQADETGEWSVPAKIGDNVSLDDYDEISPFLASDNMTMYFSSDRPGGKGSYDIWMTKRLDESWTKWSDPVNLGDSINTKGWEAYFTVDAKAEYGYLSSAKTANGHTDIGRVKLGETQKPNAVVMVYGNIYNSITKQPMSANLFFDYLPEENNAGISMSNNDGKYKYTLPYGNVYSLRASADKFFSVVDTLDLTSINPYMEIHRDLYLTPVVTDGQIMTDSAGNVIRVDVDNALSLDSNGNFVSNGVTTGSILSTNNILFDFAKSILRAESYKELDKIAMLMRTNKNVQIELSAHTDAIGGYVANLKLSEDRANAARQYLMSKGISADRVIAKGYGETTPVATNNTEEGRQLNRRVEFRILKK